jgi:hypothetical protein
LCSGCFKIAGHRRENPARGKGFGRFAATLDRIDRRIGASLNLSLFSIWNIKQPEQSSIMKSKKTVLSYFNNKNARALVKALLLGLFALNRNVKA